MSEKTRRLCCVLLILLTGLWAYHNSFAGPFIFDDLPAIAMNPHVRHLWPMGDLLMPPQELGTFAGRPLINLSLAINYALGGLKVWGYHAVNLAIHLGAGLALFGVVRRTRRAAEGIALAAALLWIAHPLQTQSVTYVIQRSESLMGLCYLLSLYSAIRGVEAAHPHGWQAAAVGWCAAGMASKPAMISLPMVLLLYDRTFLSGTFAEAWRRRKGLYLSLAAVCVLLGWLLRPSAALAGPAASFPYRAITPWQYALTQSGVIVHYLRLVVWPHPLVLDYDWPLAARLSEAWPSAVAVAALIAAACWSLRRVPVVGCLTLCCFLLLAPSSSLFPLADLACEHRMYLALAPIMLLIVLWAARLRVGAAAFLLAAAVVLLGSRTIARNADYRSALSIWQATVAARPRNPRAHLHLADALAERGRRDDALAHYTEALRLQPDYPDAHTNLGKLLAQQGHMQAAIGQYAEALRVNPFLVEARNNLANAYLMLGEVPAAIAEYQAALRIRPRMASLHYNLGNAYAYQADWEAANVQYAQALRDDPSLVEARVNLGNVFLHQGRVEDAIASYTEALRRNPALATARRNLKAAQAMQNPSGK